MFSKLKSITTSSDASEALLALQSSASDQSLFDHAFPAIARLILLDLVPNWLPVLPSDTRRLFIDPLFLTSSPPSLALLALSSCLAEVATQPQATRAFTSSILVDLSVQLVHLHLPALVSAACSDSPVIDTALLSLPSRAANATQDNPFPHGLGRQCTEALLTCLGHPNAPRFLGRMCQTGWSSQVAQVLLASPSDAVGRVVANVSSSVGGSLLIEAIVRASPGADPLFQVLGPALEGDGLAVHVVVDRLLLCAQVLPCDTLDTIAELLTHTALLKSAVVRLATLWSTESHAVRASWQTQRHVTHALLACLVRCTERDGIVAILLPGITMHMSHPVARITHLGMVVAEVLSTLIDLGEPLSFDRPTNGQFEYEFERREVEKAEKVEEPVFPIDDASQDDSDDPDAPVALRPLWERREEEEEDDGLVAYALDEGPEKVDAGGTMRSRYYPGDLAQSLRAKDKPAVVEQALNSVVSVVREGRGVDEAAPALTMQLLQLGDEFGLPSFSTLRLDGLIALAVTAPLVVLPLLANQFSTNGLGLGQRADVLYVLDQAARELCDDEHRVVLQPATQKQASDIISDRVEKRTRRWGRRHQPLVNPNRLTEQIAGLYIWPLMGAMACTHVDLLGDDCFLLARMLLLFGSTMQLVLPGPRLPLIAKAIVELVWSVRYHDSASVRRGSVFAWSSVMKALPLDLILAMLGDELDEAREWLVDVMKRDEDGETRRLAAGTIRMIADKVEERSGS